MSVFTVSKKVRALSIRDGAMVKAKVSVVRETPLSIHLNGQEVVTLLCIDDAPDYLAVGFLLSEGLIRDKNSIVSVDVHREDRAVHVRTTEEPLPAEPGKVVRVTITTGCGRGTTIQTGYEDAAPVDHSPTRPKIRIEHIFGLMRELTDLSSVYKETRGTHNCALADVQKILLFHADVGRHNAVDKIHGQCVLEKISMEEKIFLTTGRITSEILMKIGRMGIPVLVSRHAATDLAVSIGQRTRKTLVGLVRGNRFTVYSGFRRIEGYEALP